MYCPNCGTENENGALFCTACGTRLAAPAAPVAEAPAAPVAEAPAAPVVEAPAAPVAEAPAAPVVEAPAAPAAQAPVAPQPNAFPNNNAYANTGYTPNNTYPNNNVNNNGTYPVNNTYSANNMYPNNGMYQQPVTQQQSSGLAIGSIAVAAIGFFANLLLALLGWGCGIAGLVMALSAKKKNPQDKNAKIGLILSIVTLAAAAINSVAGIILSLLGAF